MVLLVLTVFVMGVVTRCVGRRHARGRRTAPAGHAPADGARRHAPPGPDTPAELPETGARGPNASLAPWYDGRDGQRPWRRTRRLGKPVGPRRSERPPRPARRPSGDQAPPCDAVPARPARPSPRPPNAHAADRRALSSTAPSPRQPAHGPAATRRTAVQAVREAAGPALVVTSDPTVWAETKDARAKLGPVLVYDPAHLCDTPARLHWSPTAGCEAPDTAAARATALLAPVRPQARIDAMTADTAETLLRCWLHAAAIDGRPFRQVHRWALGAQRPGTGTHPPHPPQGRLRTRRRAGVRAHRATPNAARWPRS